MAKESEKEFSCYLCTKKECRLGYSKGIPLYCIATKFQDTLDKTKTKYTLPDEGEIYKASAVVATNGLGKWPRVQEAIEFAKELKIKKIGLASCMALIKEMAMVGELFNGAGFEVASAGCKVGQIQPEERGFPELKGFKSTTCNPIAQAEILNSESTQLNYMLGLCLGHDILFTKYSNAPVSTLIVKDRVTGQNPVAALYASQHRRHLWKLYCDKAVD
ncbi:DUF1847 domain-containing protein [Thermodesulfobacteriota bacterium]